jgi:hypothetical protein
VIALKRVVFFQLQQILEQEHVTKTKPSADRIRGCGGVCLVSFV